MRRFLQTTLLTLLATATAIGAGPGRADEKYPVTGSPKALVILVDFPDISFETPDPFDYFDGMLHTDGFSDYFGKGSCLEYFRDNSLGLFTPQFDLYGPVTVSKSAEYYGENINNVLDPHAHEMVIEACQLLDEEVDFAQYDTDGDGVVDNVFVFYAGKGESSSGIANTIWAHSARISLKDDTPVMVDGVQLDRYACANEIEKDLPTGIGTFCHEFTHVLGLPDVYSTDLAKGFTAGSWDVMDHGSLLSNSRKPCYMTAFERYALGWLEPEELQPGREYSLRPIGENQAYIIRTSNPNEYFLLENRQKTDWDKYLPGHGMLLWHIDVQKERWDDNTPNNDPEHLCIDIIEADNRPSETSIPADAFPGTDNITSISRASHPMFASWGGESLGVVIKDIRELADGTITFRTEADGTVAGDFVLNFAPEGANNVRVGYQVADHYDVAMFISGEDLLGFDARLKEFRFIVPMDNSLDNFEVWASTSLRTPSGGQDFRGDICHVSLDPDYLDDSDLYGELSYELNDPYKIPFDGVYIGYSFDVRTDGTNVGKFPMVVNDMPGANVLYSRLATIYPDFEVMEGIVAACTATLSGKFAETAAGVTSQKLYAKTGEPSELKATIVNNCKQPVKSVDYTCAVGTSLTGGTLQVDLPGVFGAKQEVLIPVEAIAQPGALEGVLTITRVNNDDNLSAAPGTTFNAKVLDRIPVHRTVAEEFSGTWCGNCPRGFAGMEILRDNFEDFIGISYHYNDVMEMKTGVPYSPYAYPMLYMDRDGVHRDPYFGTSAFTSNAIAGSIVGEYAASNETFAPADIEVSAKWNEDFTGLEITSEVNFAEVPDDGFNLRVAYVVLEDGLTGETAEWYQENWLSGETALRQDPYLKKYVRAAKTITDMVYDDVAVYATNAKGIANSLPKYKDLREDVVYTHTHEVALDDFRNRKNKPSYQNPDNMRVVAMLVKQDGSEVGKICNGAIAKVPSASAVNEIEADCEVVAVTWHDLAGRCVANPGKGIYIRTEKMSDGSLRTSKITR